MIAPQLKKRFQARPFPRSQRRLQLGKLTAAVVGHTKVDGLPLTTTASQEHSVYLTLRAKPAQIKAVFHNPDTHASPPGWKAVQLTSCTRDWLHKAHKARISGDFQPHRSNHLEAPGDGQQTSCMQLRLYTLATARCCTPVCFVDIVMRLAHGNEG